MKNFKVGDVIKFKTPEDHSWYNCIFVVYETLKDARFKIKILKAGPNYVDDDVDFGIWIYDLSLFELAYPKVNRHLPDWMMK